jgi:hypothetical protein
MYTINFGVFDSNVFLTLKIVTFDDLFLTKNIHRYMLNIMDA